MLEKRKKFINGVLLLDKPSHLGSQIALQKVKCALGSSKAGHIGTLDPLASGLLPICFGEATKFSRFKNDADKRYRAAIKLGVRTDSGDAYGKIISCQSVTFTNEVILDALKSFMGCIEQVPPMYSALKHKGKPLYEYARKGVKVDRLPRKITIYSINLCEHQRNDADIIEVDVHCSKGTYIRSLADDLGNMLGCGAHLISLRRLSVGDWHVDQAIGLDCLLSMMSKNTDCFELNDRLSKQGLSICKGDSVDFELPPFFLLNSLSWLSVDALVSGLSMIILDFDQANRFLLGQRLHLDYSNIIKNFEEAISSDNYFFSKNSSFSCSKQKIFDAGTVFAIYNFESDFLGIANWFSDVLSPVRVMNISAFKKDLI